MKIEEFRSEQENNRAKIAATVVWENCDRPVQELYFETDEEFAGDISCNPHAFLVACIMPAMRFGEKRLFIDAEICPELKDGLITNMGLISNWYDWYVPERDIIRIEAKTQSRALYSAKSPRAAFLFSGGVDSLATLRANRINYPLEHPGSIKDGLLVYGLEVNKPKNFDYVMNSVSVLAQDTDVTLIPVYTNIRSLGQEKNSEFWDDFWVNEFMGATFSAIAHVFSRRITSLSINSCHDIPNLMPYGSHPLINPNYSSSDMRIRHEGIHLSRYEKTKIISDWDLALQHLRVCNKTEYYQADTLNCGKCEKCVRTMLSLLALGVLKKSSAFPVNDVSEELIEEAVQLGANTIPLYSELLAPLSEIGRNDLVRAIERKITSFPRLEFKKKWKKRTIDPIARFDKEYLNGSIKKIKSSFSS